MQAAWDQTPGCHLRRLWPRASEGPSPHLSPQLVQQREKAPPRGWREPRRVRLPAEARLACPACGGHVALRSPPGGPPRPGAVPAPTCAQWGRYSAASSLRAGADFSPVTWRARGACARVGRAWRGVPRYVPSPEAWLSPLPSSPRVAEGVFVNAAEVTAASHRDTAALYTPLLFGDSQL